jgi:hypothetical protein
VRSKGDSSDELLPEDQTVDANRYSDQLHRLNQEIVRKRPFTVQGNRKVLLLHDNARPHIAIRTRQKIEELG